MRKCANTQTHKYTSTQIYNNIITQIHKQMHKYINKWLGSGTFSDNNSRRFLYEIVIIIQAISYK